MPLPERDGGPAHFRGGCPAPRHPPARSGLKCGRSRPLWARVALHGEATYPASEPEAGRLKGVFQGVVTAR